MLQPVPVPDNDTAPYWASLSQGQWKMQRCNKCGRWNWPPRPRCCGCLSDELTWRALTGEGSIYSYCIVHTDLVRGFSPPYVVAHVELIDQVGLRVISNIIDVDISEIDIGMRVEMWPCSTEDGFVIPKFKLKR